MSKKKKETVLDSELETGSLTIIIPFRLYLVIYSISKKVGTEWSILAKVEKEEGLKIWLDNDYYIPLQEVTSASVDYLEDLYELQNKGYMAVIHAHPGTSKPYFSKTDIECINTFKVSIVTNREASQFNASVAINYNNAILQIPAEVEIELETVDTSKIKEKKEPVIETKYGWQNNKWRIMDGY